MKKIHSLLQNNQQIVRRPRLLIFVINFSPAYCLTGADSGCWGATFQLQNCRTQLLPLILQPEYHLICLAIFLPD